MERTCTALTTCAHRRTSPPGTPGGGAGGGPPAVLEAEHLTAAAPYYCMYMQQQNAKPLDEYFDQCLDSTVNSLAREISRMAEHLHLAPSTISRLTDKVILRGRVRKKHEMPSL